MKDVKCAERALSPLHIAVIKGDEKVVASLRADIAQSTSKEACGFTPLELAQLLGKDRCQQLLHGLSPACIKVQVKGEIEPASLSIADFERIFNVIYRPFLVFESYEQLKEVIHSCPYLLRSHWLANENYDCGRKYAHQLGTGMLADVSIKWISDEIGYGVFAETDIPGGAFIGEYTGVVRRLYRKRPDHNPYCFRYPTRLWCLKYFVVDAFKESNSLRFINHSDKPNLQPLCAVDRGLLHQIFISNCFIPKGTQLTFDYGADYWIRRQKAMAI